MVSAFTAVIESGTLCSVSERLRAVTVISSMLAGELLSGVLSGLAGVICAYAEALNAATARTPMPTTIICSVMMPPQAHESVSRRHHARRDWLVKAAMPD